MSSTEAKRPPEPPAPMPPRMQELFDGVSESRTDYWVVCGVFVAVLFAIAVGVAIEISRPKEVDKSRFVVVEQVDGHEFIINPRGGIVHHPDCVKCRESQDGK